MIAFTNHFLILGALIFHLPLLILFVLLAGRAMTTRYLQKELQDKGYYFLTLPGAMRLRRSIGKARLRHLPPYDDYATIPGSEDDVPSLISVGSCLRTYRKLR